MPKRSHQSEIKIQVSIKPVKLVELTTAQRQLAKKFWTRLIAECQRESKAESEAGESYLSAL